ncbi:MAG TPA: trigger factor [Acidobacteriota bacterium]|nr:trigger factor [Acidobacteriota bacterium]
MTLEIIEVNSCKRNLAVEVPAEEVEKEIIGLAREYARTAKIPGFRPGKVPLNIIRQRYMADLTQEATLKIIDRCWKDAIAEHDLHPLAQPSVQDVQNEPGGSLKFTVSFEVLPSLKIDNYTGIDVTLPSSEVPDEKVAEAVENLREQNAQFIPVDEGEACDGHHLTLTVEGRFDGNIAPPTREDDVVMVIGDPQTNTEFSDNLRGARAGETRTFKISYPEDYHRKQFAGKNVGYTIHVKDIKEKRLADLNDDFAKDHGYDSLEALKKKVRDDLVTQAKRNAEKKARESLLDTIIERHTIDIPECLVQEELEVYANRITRTLAYQGIDVAQTKIDWEKMLNGERPKAEQSVRRGLLLDEIARRENISVMEEDLVSELENFAAGTNKSAVALRAQLEKEQRIQVFEQQIRRNKALEFLYHNANIIVG